jgi:rhamnogalacturonyl hydrolase YesR
MAITSLIRGVRMKILPKAEYDPIIKLAWKGLLSTVLPNGTVTQVCCGTGIQRSAQAYYDRPTSYTCSGPGGAGAVLYAAVDLSKGY